MTARRCDHHEWHGFAELIARIETDAEGSSTETLSSLQP